MREKLNQYLSSAEAASHPKLAAVVESMVNTIEKLKRTKANVKTAKKGGAK